MMTTVKDAYQPLLVTAPASKFWLRFKLIALLLIVALGLMIYTGIRIKSQLQMQDVKMNSIEAKPQ